MNSFVLKGDLCYSKDAATLNTQANGYLVCVNGVSEGVFTTLPERYKGLPLLDHSGMLITPGLVDLHMHAPQFAFRGLGMDLELLDWLNTRTFPEEAKYADLNYARSAYTALVNDLRRGPNTRICLFGTIHLPATALLMQLLDEAGLGCYVGKVNMDRNSPAALCEESAAASATATRAWLEDCAGKYRHVAPILTPRFVPSCSDELMQALAALRQEYHLPVQSHLSENQSEVAWVRELCPESSSYAGAYNARGLLGGETAAIMAHCVWSGEEEMQLLRGQNVYVAHCPQSNENLSSGIAPVRKFLQNKVQVGLGSDVAGGCHTSIFRAMADAIQVSKLRWRLVDGQDAPLTIPEAFWLGTAGGGAFFGRVGSFDAGYELDALVLDDRSLSAPFELSIPERLARVIYLADDRQIAAKFSCGEPVFTSASRRVLKGA